MKLRDSLSAAFWVLMGHVFGRGSLVLSSLLLSHALTKHEFAAFTFFALTAQTVAAYATAGMGVAISMRAAEVALKQTDETHGARTNLELLLFAALGIGVAVGLAGGSLTSWISPDLDIPAWLFGPTIAAFVIVAAMQAALLGLERFRAIASLAALSATLLLGLTAWASSRKDANIAMAGLLAATLFQAAGQSLLVLQALRNEESSVARRRSWLRFWTDLKSTIGPMSLVTVISASGPWLVGRLLLSGPDGYRLFGTFVIGMQWFALAVLLPSVVARSNFASLVRAGAHGDNQAYVDQVSQQLKNATFAAVTVVLIGALFAPSLVTWYGAGYLDTPSVLIAYMLAGGLAGVGDVLGNSILVRSGAKLWLQVSLLWLFVLVCTVALLGWESAWSSPVAFLVAYATRMVAAATVAKRVEASRA